MISIIVAVKNNKEQLKRLFDSIESQTVEKKHYELLVVDAASTDGTVELIRGKENVIAWSVSEKDSGVYEAWNKALQHAKGEWISFVGSDDFFPNNKTLQLIMAELEKAATDNKLYVYGRCNLYSWHQQRIVGCYNAEAQELMNKLGQGKFILHSGSYHHRSLFDRYGKFDEKYKIAGDYAFLLKYLKDQMPHFINAPIVNMGINGLSSGLSNKHINCLFKECLHAYHNNLSGFPWRIYARFLSQKISLLVRI